MRPEHLKNRCQKRVIPFYRVVRVFALILKGLGPQVEAKLAILDSQDPPQSYKIQSFGSMCPRYFPRGSKVAPIGVPRRAQISIWGRFSIDLGALFRYFGLRELILSTQTPGMSVT